MISIFDDAGNRLSVTWNSIEFNDPTLTRYDAAGKRLEHVGFSTPVNFHTEAIDDIVKNGGGIELYNPRVGTRILNMRGSIRADTESELMSEIVLMQRAFSPLYLQANFQRARADLGADLDINTTGTLQWPPPSGLPTWVRSLPLKFTRVMPRAPGFYEGTWSTSYPDGKLLLQYHVVPLALPDPIRASVSQGVGVDYEASFLIMDGGRSFDQTDTRVLDDGNCPVTWGRAPTWPLIDFDMTGAGNAAMTITTSGTQFATALVLDLTTLSSADHVEVDCRDRSIWVNNTATPTLYASGDYPVIGDYISGVTAVAWTNTGGIESATNRLTYRESDYV